MECELTRDPCISERLTCKSSIQAPASVAAPPGQQLFTTADVCFSHHTLWEETAAIVQTRSLNGHQGVFAGNPSWFLIFTIQLHLQVVFVKCLMVKRWEGMQGMRVAAEPPFRTSLCYRVHHDTEWQLSFLLDKLSEILKRSGSYLIFALVLCLRCIESYWLSKQLFHPTFQTVVLVFLLIFCSELIGLTCL